ncbi:MAG TPA: DUF1822 family protein [Coleofasciculaceae cyanobacterium]
MNCIAASFSITFRLGWEAEQIAKKFSKHQSNFQLAQQVYRNTLAVHTVNFYLQCLGIQTDLEASDSWNPVMQSLADIADLEVKNLGKIECRSVSWDAESVYIPAEAWQGRIGYVVVQLNETTREATLLGFVKKVTTEELPLNQLRPLEDLPDYINQLKSQSVQKLVKLREWLNSAFESGWQALEEILELPPNKLAVNFRGGFRGNTKVADNSITRGKLLDLGWGDQLVALCVALNPIDESELDISVEVCPIGNQRYLPEKLNLILLDENGDPVMQAQTRNTKTMQLQFSGETGERFGVKVALGNVSITEEFLA